MSERTEQYLQRKQGSTLYLWPRFPTGGLTGWKPVPHRRRGALLLEVVVALTILVMAMGMLGAQLVGGLRMTADAEEMTLATQLADRMMALVELDPNTLQAFFEQREIDGDFDAERYDYNQYRGWFWRAAVEEIPDNPELGRVTIEILHQTDPDRINDVEDARIVRTLHLLKAQPGRIDLAADFGIPQEQLDMFAAMVPIDGFNPSALDPLAIASLDPQMLMEMLPMLLPLLQQFGGGKLPADFSPEMLQELLSGGGLGDLSGMIPGAGGRGGGPNGAGGGGPNAAVIEMIRSTLGGQLSDEELDALLNNMGPGAGGPVPGAGPPGGGLRIEDLDDARDAANDRRDRLGRDRGGR